MLQERARCAAMAIGVFLLATSFGACGSPASVQPSLSRITESFQQGRYREATDLSRALLGRLDEWGQGDSLEAAETIDLLRRAEWKDRGCAAPDA
ncbi:MAG TPA: hypothetical protein VGR38_10435, partial [Candidatus Polarisedimenticolia bacterium]|nr:hypothetical protein [Candidatus Polarisedimenticolia bacterium]